MREKKKWKKHKSTKPQPGGTPREGKHPQHVWSLGSRDKEVNDETLPFLAPDVVPVLSGHSRRFTQQVCVWATGRGQRLKRPAGVSQTLTAVRATAAIFCVFVRTVTSSALTAGGSTGRWGHRLTLTRDDARKGGGQRGDTGEEKVGRESEGSIPNFFKNLKQLKMSLVLQHEKNKTKNYKDQAPKQYENSRITTGIIIRIRVIRIRIHPNSIAMLNSCLWIYFQGLQQTQSSAENYFKTSLKTLGWTSVKTSCSGVRVGFLEAGARGKKKKSEKPNPPSGEATNPKQAKIPLTKHQLR